MKAYLIGAGPGDPGLLTIKGRAALAAADVVIYDHLANEAFLEAARPDAERIYVGKTEGVHTLPQSEINRLLLEKAREGKVVARLKGGDPYVFGRGGEEAEALAAAGIPFEEIPGVTSAIAAPAYAGIPVTHRGLSSSVCFITGHEDPSKPESVHNWDALARSASTLVFVMGVKNLPMISKKLIDAGMRPDMPAALIRWGTTALHASLVSTLDALPEEARARNMTPPCVLVVGEVVRLHDSLNWFEKKPLLGKGVVVTRAREQAGELRSRLEALGARVFEFPTIAVTALSDEPVRETALRLSRYDWVVFTSANGVERFFSVLTAMGRDARIFAQCRIAAMGPGTAQALGARGILPDFVPKRFVAESMAEGLVARGICGLNVLIPRARNAREALPEALVAAGASVTVLPVYETMPVCQSKDAIMRHLEAGDIHCITFASSSTVRNFFERIAPETMRAFATVRFACIGPVTRATLEEFGFPANIEPQEYTIPALVEAIELSFKNS